MHWARVEVSKNTMMAIPIVNVRAHGGRLSIKFENMSNFCPLGVLNLKIWPFSMTVRMLRIMEEILSLETRHMRTAEAGKHEHKKRTTPGGTYEGHIPFPAQSFRNSKNQGSVDS